MTISNALATVIYRACEGLFEEIEGLFDDDPKTLRPRREKMADFMRALEELGVSQNDLTEIVTVIPGEWMHGWPDRYRDDGWIRHHGPDDSE